MRSDMKLTIALCLSCLVSGAMADQVTLKSGGVLEGEIIRETPSGVTLRASYGTVEISSDRIASVTRKSYAPRRKTEDPAPVAPTVPPPAGARPAPGTKPPTLSPNATAPKKGMSEAERNEWIARITTAAGAFGSFEHSKEAEDAANGLVALGKDVVPILVERIPEMASTQQKWCVQVLQQIGDPRAADLLLGMVNSPKGEVRSVTAQALGSMKDPRAIQPLIALVEDGDWTVRRDAANALRDLKAKEALPVLIEHLADVNLFVRAGAHDALRAISGEDFSSNAEEWRAWMAKQPPVVPERKDVTGRPLDAAGGNAPPPPGE